MSSKKTIFVGYIISSDSDKNLNILNGYITIESGKIIKIGNVPDLLTEYPAAYTDKTEFEVIELPEGHFLIPGFIDCHTHAPQFPNIGLGLDRPLLEWLAKYTFPLEKKYCDIDFAASVYDTVVRRLLVNGTTTACYFGTLSSEGTKQLANTVVKQKQRALVGKVSMNIQNEADYYNDTEKETAEAETFVKYVLGLNNDLVKPIITPRFAVSCDSELMTNLSMIAQKNKCMIQSHISENIGEIQFVLKSNPDASSYTDVYDKCNILNNKCIMAHAVHLSEEEMRILSERGVSIAHCPASNTRLMSGLCPVKKLLAHNITVGLGTDVSGGDSPSILETMRRTMDVSLHLQLKGHSNSSITWKEAFYLATLGGANALNLGDKIGSFEVGKEFDAIEVSVFKPGSAIDHYDYSVDTTETEIGESLLQRFIYLGDDRNIENVYVKGVELKSSNKSCLCEK